MRLKAIIIPHAYLMLTLVLGHVDPDKGLLLVAMEIVGQLLGQLSFTDTRGTEEEHDKGVVVIKPAVFLPPHS